MDPVIQVMQGESVDLNCEAMLGNPPPTITWLRNGTEVVDDFYTSRLRAILP